MSKKVAVLTDSVSTQFYFPIWYDYYSGQFGSDNIFVLTAHEELENFNNFKMGGIETIPVYNNNLRLEKITAMVEYLLRSYDYVIRVDTDEFVVPNLDKFSSLNHYIESTNLDHITAYGFNIISEANDEPIDLSRSLLLKQRRIVYPYDALCKTCVVTKPTKWTPGFHFCSDMPKFDDLFLFHTKLADVDIQYEIGKKVSSMADENAFKEYHETPKSILELRVGEYRTYPRLSGMQSLYRFDYIKKFVDGFSFTPDYGGVYHGPAWEAEKVLIYIPDQFEGTF